MRKNPYIDIINANGHDFIEIGGVKWATCNIGAEKPWEPGLYFAWGETDGYSAEDVIVGKKSFKIDDYKFVERGPTFYKYNREDGSGILDLEDDAANVNWGGSWRMPTADEFVKFGESVETQFVDYYKGSNISGLLCTDKADSTKQLFFPEIGYCCGTRVISVVNCGLYWTSSIASWSFKYAKGQCMYGDSVNWGCNSFGRIHGFTIRAVLDC